MLEGVFRQAGFADVELGVVQERESVWSEVEDAMCSFESPDGFEAPGECLIGAATK